MTRERLDLGRGGEDLAARHLSGLGYRLLGRSVRSRLGELDLVMKDGPTIVFIEVKTRSSGRFGEPEEAVDPRKQARIARAAQVYLKLKGWTDVPMRFDVVAISGGRVRHIPDAFSSPF